MALVAGLLQIIASIVLGLAPLERFTAAANEGPRAYLVVAALVGAGTLTIWLVRERLAIAVALAAIWPLAMWLGLRPHTTKLGLAYHGEFILHHFSALLCLVLAIGVPIGWARDRRLGKLRLVPAALAIPGALALAASHFGQLPVGPAWLASGSLASTGAALLFAAWPAAAALFWRQLGPRQRRPLAWVLLLPLLVRVGLAGWEGLSGRLVAQEHISWVGATIVFTAIATLILLRPRLERWVMAVVGTICLLGSMFAYWLYEHGFGELEDGLGGLLQSLLGFAVPYPSYVDDLSSAALMMGLFFAFVTVYSALVSAEDRVRGIALGLMVVAGLGFSSPHLAMMFGVGALLVIEGMLPGAPHRELLPPASRWAAYEREYGGEEQSSEGAVEIIEALAERLGLDRPTVVWSEDGIATIGLRGEIPGSTRAPMLDLRAHTSARSTSIELSVGLPGREQPVFELIPEPGSRGTRPAHLLARSHKIKGEPRALEAFGDAPLDAMTCFPSARLRAWDGGVEVDLGRVHATVRVDHLEALIRSLARALDGP